jgi:hypothetical protein
VRWPPACEDVNREQTIVHSRKTFPSGAVKTVIENTTVYDSDLQNVVTNCVLKCSINPITNPNPVYSRTYHVIIYLNLIGYIVKSNEREYNAF